LNGTKARTNQTEKNTGLILTMPKNLFKDENRKTSPDLRVDYGEDRWVTIGKLID